MNLPENNQQDNPQRIYESVRNFFDNNHNNLVELLNFHEAQPCLMFNIIRSFMDELYNIDDFDICLEIYSRKLRQLRDEVNRYDNYVNNQDNMNNYIDDIWQTTKIRYSRFRRNMYVYINFAILYHIDVAVDGAMIDNIYNQVNNQVNNHENNHENENENQIDINNNIIH